MFRNAGGGLTLMLLALVTLFSGSSDAADAGPRDKPKPTLSEALQQSRSSLVLRDGKLSGSGAELLARDIADSRFVFIGEDHITREIPRFASAVCDLMHPDAYALETGPHAAEFVTSQLGKPDRIARTAERMKAHPHNMAFLDIREESDSAAHCARTSNNPGFRIWGLDQEFIGAAGTLLEGMAATEPGPKSLAAIAAAQALNKAADQQARLSGDPGMAFLLAATDAELKPLRDAVDVDGNAATRNLLDELLASREIYRLNSEGSPDSNRVRAELFKQHFLADYSAAKARMASPRVLFKLGDNHSGKGFSVLHVRDIGNFVAELADGEDAQSLHILVLGARGTHATFAGYAKPLGKEPFVMTGDPGYRWLEPAIAHSLPQPVEGEGTTLTLFDLRKLRFRGIDLPRDWERVAYGYDLLVLMPELTPASAIQ